MRSPAVTTSPYSRGPGGNEATHWEKEFQHLLPELRERLWTDSTLSNCPLRDLGDYVLQEFQLIVYFFERIAEETMDKHRKFCMDRLTDFDDGSVTKYLMAREGALRKIRSQLTSTANTCRDIWTAVPSASSIKTVSQFVPINAPLSPQQGPSHTSPSPQDVHRDCSGISRSIGFTPDESVAIRVRTLDEPEMFEGVEDYPYPSGDQAGDELDDSKMDDGDQLNNWMKGRGKSDANICPYGRNCTMKGYDPVTGEMKVFLLNSAFNDHMKKHAKPYVCTKCGTRFARKAALQRHQNTPLHQSGGQPPTVKFVQANKDY